MVVAGGVSYVVLVVGCEDVVTGGDGIGDAVMRWLNDRNDCDDDCIFGAVQML